MPTRGESRRVARATRSPRLDSPRAHLWLRSRPNSVGINNGARFRRERLGIESNRLTSDRILPKFDLIRHAESRFDASNRI
jgi:hypothetical protein